MISTVTKLSQKPRNLFLIDGVGAILSAFLLGVVLVYFKSYFGIPVNTLYVLAIIPCFFALYDLLCYFLLKKNHKPFIKLTAWLNIAYCGLSLRMAYEHIGQIEILGFIYIIIEVILVLAIAKIELDVAKSIS